MGSWRVTDWGNVGGARGMRGSNVNQLTRSWDYTWNERRMEEKEGGWANKTETNELRPNHGSNNIYGACDVPAQKSQQKENGE